MILALRFYSKIWKYDVSGWIIDWLNTVEQVFDYRNIPEHLMFWSDVEELEKQIIAHFLGGLHVELSNVLQLQPHWTSIVVIKLAFKIEKQEDEAKSRNNRFQFKGVRSTRLVLFPRKLMYRFGIFIETTKQRGSIAIRN